MTRIQINDEAMKGKALTLDHQYFKEIVVFWVVAVFWEISLIRVRSVAICVCQILMYLKPIFAHRRLTENNTWCKKRVCDFDKQKPQLGIVTLFVVCSALTEFKISLTK